MPEAPGCKFLVPGRRNVLIEGNVFHDLTAAGIVVGLQGKTWVNYVTVRNNVIRATGLDFCQASGIYANRTKNLKVHHNDVADVAYFGINQRYGSDTGMPPATEVGNTEFSFNRVVNYGTAARFGFGLTDEVAGFYFFGVRDSTIKDNYSAYGGRDDHLAGAFRQDQGGTHNVFDSNVADCRPAARSFSAMSRGAKGMTFRNCFANVQNENRGGDIKYVDFHLEKNAPPWSEEAQAIIDGAGPQEKYRHLLDDMNNGWNIAAGKPASASTEWDQNMTAKYANDVNCRTCWHNKAVGEKGEVSWWQVDLGEPYAIQKIQIVARYNTDQPGARRNFQVWASGDSGFAAKTVFGGQADQPYAVKNNKACRWTEYQLNTWDLYVTDPTAYRYLRVVKMKKETFNFAEFRAYGCPGR